jgi:hypothetical protein
MLFPNKIEQDAYVKMVSKLGAKPKRNYWNN